jgi:hypothetical protein
MSELIMSHVAGTTAEKLSWLRQQRADGKLDGEDPDEIAEAEALLLMLTRIAGSKGSKQKRHLDELLDEGLRETFPASDPVSVGHFTATELPSRSVDTPAVDVRAVGEKKERREKARVRRR